MKTLISVLCLCVLGVSSTFAQSKVAAGIDAVAPTPKPKASPNPLTDDPKYKSSEKVVKLMLKQGVLRRLEPQERKAWVDSITWVMLDAYNKEVVTRALAIYVSPAYPEIDVYDAQSARRIASYGPFQGFKVY